MESTKFRFGGDTTVVITGPAEVDISHINFFDELEYDCWKLIKKYAGAFGFSVENIDGENDDIDFYAAKQIQDRIIELFEESGVVFAAGQEQNLTQSMGGM